VITVHELNEDHVTSLAIDPHDPSSQHGSNSRQTVLHIPNMSIALSIHHACNKLHIIFGRTQELKLRKKLMAKMALRTEKMTMFREENLLQIQETLQPSKMKAL
jgi:bifunctional ADP-heptose synthase (sugar kinase/adenylyltransferase)